MNVSESGEALELPTHLRYPISEFVNDMPGRPVQNEVLAEEMAYAEEPYRQLAAHALQLGLEDAQVNMLDAANKGSATAEKSYYERFGTTKAAAKQQRSLKLRAVRMANMSVAELNPVEYEHSLQILNDLRGAVQVFGDIGLNYTDGATVTIVHSSTNAPLRRLIQTYEGSLKPEESGKFPFESYFEFYEEPYKDFQTFYRNKISKTLGDIFRTAKARRVMGGESYPMATEATNSIKGAVVSEVTHVVRSAQQLVGEGTVGVSTAIQIIEGYDLARYSANQFDEVVTLLKSDESRVFRPLKLLKNIPEEYVALRRQYEDQLREKAANREEALRQKDIKKAQDALARATARLAELSVETHSLPEFIEN